MLHESVKVSIVIPSYAQGHFIERTIQSIISQGYPSLELIICDGGSTDDTLSIIKRYEQFIYYSVSGPDNGQSHAINKGFAKATGDIVAWINSDDMYLPGTISKVVDAFKDPDVRWVTGDCEVIDQNDHVIDYYRAELPKSDLHWLALFVLGHSTAFIQPSTFWRREVLKQAGYLRENFHYSFDHEFFFRVWKEYGKPHMFREPLSQFRLHSQSKTVSQDERFTKENRRIGWMHSREESLKDRLYLYGIYIRQLLRNG